MNFTTKHWERNQKKTTKKLTKTERVGPPFKMLSELKSGAEDVKEKKRGPEGLLWFYQLRVMYSLKQSSS